MAGCIGIEESRKWGRRGCGKSGALRRLSPRLLASLPPRSVFVKYLSCRGGHYLLSTGVLFDLGLRISPRPGKERFEIGYTMPVLTGKEEVFAAVPEGLFTELLCAVTAAAEVKGMDLGLGIKAGCFRARRGERRGV